MTASSITTAQPAATAGPGPAGQAAGRPPGAGGLAGFEALLAALFPAGGAVTPTVAGSPSGAADASAEEEGSKGEANADGKGASAELIPAPAVDPSALAAALTAPAPPQGAPTAGPSEAPGDGQAVQRQALRSVAIFAPMAEPAPAGEAVAAEATPDAEPPAAGATPPGLAVQTDGERGNARAAPPPAFGRDKAPASPAAPALENANPRADLASKAATADAAPDAPLPASAPEATPTGAAQLAQATPPPAQTPRAEPAPKAARSERKGGSARSESLDAPGAAETAAKPMQAKAAEAAAKPAATTAPAEAAERPVGDDIGSADTVDPAPQAESRAAAQSSATAAHTAHGVRGSPETVANLAAQIVRKLEERATRFDLELDPAGLGRVDVRLEIGANGKLTASMLFDNPQAANELRARAAELQRVLEQAGFDLSGGLSFDVADQGRHQGQAWQDQGEPGRAFRGQAFRAALETAGEAADVAGASALRLRRGVNSGVDVRI
ncbi:MAG: flagellar hook-length control protein FliK [Phenylobacterium sp.]|uniref:flagellar hook-length control protein FliK n=1 Tax=Phenylobacterium sp. TaxID=1871053 RepID=UPI001A59D890|nr:flagellar hook-length control protein FliK [Phenylobacterium sp.]MBL8770780.1 flagellar hook-length control protein FliK [Phenylobacterium sp.]